MAASEAAVTAVQKQMRCEKRAYIGYGTPGRGHYCRTHGYGRTRADWTDRGCPVAVAAADAAVDANRASIQAETLREAARDLPGFDGIRTHGDAARWLRARADRIENQP